MGANDLPEAPEAGTVPQSLCLRGSMAKWLSLHPLPQNLRCWLSPPLFSQVCRISSPPSSLCLPQRSSHRAASVEECRSHCSGQEKMQAVQGLPRASLPHEGDPEVSATGINPSAPTCEDQQKLREAGLPAVTLLWLLGPAL